MLLLITKSTWSQNQQSQKPPKLVVGIVVDQMRYDYLTRFYSRFDDGGFKRLINQGFIAKNHHINYVPTYTAPGHASLHTGTTPSNHGILGNFWFDNSLKRIISCIEDSTVTPVGTGSKDQLVSPRKIAVTTLADQNKLHTQQRGKTISIALKDRAAVLSGGHTADAAYWFRGKQQGAWITSSYYMQKLPPWVQKFNDSDHVDAYMNVWNTLYPIATYTASGPDQTKFDRGYRGKDKAVFPYNLNDLQEQNKFYDILRTTPFGNSLTVDFALEAIKGEALGKDRNTDFLLISFSSTDYIGHNFGVNSVEIEDTYLRLDRDLSRLLQSLDLLVGKEQYTLFLTADHGGSQVANYLTSNSIPSGYFKEASFINELVFFIQRTFGISNGIHKVMNNNIYLNKNAFLEKNISLENVWNQLANYILQQEGISTVITRKELLQNSYKEGFGSYAQQGFYPTRSGDLVFALDPAITAYAPTGSAHGTHYNYDTHIPLLFFGKGIRCGSTSDRTAITDVVPTIATLLKIAEPNGCTGNIIQGVLRE